MAISFGGAQITRPGSYSVVDTTGMVVTNAGSFRVLAFVGQAPSAVSGLNKSEVLYYNTQNTDKARKDLGSGDLIKHMDAAWKHGADLIAVSLVNPALAEAPTDSEWQDAIDRLNKTFVDAVIPVSTEGAIIAKVQTHNVTMSSTINRRERRGFFGHPTGVAKEEVISLVNSAATERAVFASPGVYDYSADGSKVLYPSTLLAAAYAGLWAGKEPQDPITYDYVQFPGLEVEYEAADISELLEAGVAVTEVTRKGFRIVQGRTASPSENVTEQELSVSTLKDVMSMDMRDVLEEKHVGKAGVAGIEQTIFNDAMSRILEYKRLNYISEYVEGTLKITKNGTVFETQWEGKPVLPINNFLITSRFTL
jgi:hypothetical protein